jgi:hypothetical protein
MIDRRRVDRACMHFVPKRHTGCSKGRRPRTGQRRPIDVVKQPRPPASSCPRARRSGPWRWTRAR